MEGESAVGDDAQESAQLLHWLTIWLQWDSTSVGWDCYTHSD